MNLINVQNVGKTFRQYTTEWQRFAHWFGLPVQSSAETWVLRHINFDVQPGEAIGLIGRNGAGKSTLLKMITGTMRPTEGKIKVNGRISAILELGLGFNPNISGRENVRHAAGLMGFTAKQIEKAMPNIEEFADIGDYFNEPLRTYSSGMQMRVAFAAATAWRPEILIIDEALSVGDTYFQHKSFERIRQFREQGTSLIIVSHSRNAIQTLCDRAILLEKGTIIKDGDPEEVFDYYNALIAEKENQTVEHKKQENGKTQTTSGTGEASFEEITLYNSQQQATDCIAVGESVELRIRVRIHRSIDSLVLGYGIKDRFGRVLYGTNTWHTGQVIENPAPGNEYVFAFTFAANLGIGSYSIQTALSDKETHLTANYEWRNRALIFDVINIDKHHFVGCLWNEPSITVKKTT